MLGDVSSIFDFVAGSGNAAEDLLGGAMHDFDYHSEMGAHQFGMALDEPENDDDMVLSNAKQQQLKPKARGKEGRRKSGMGSFQRKSGMGSFQRKSGMGSFQRKPSMGSTSKPKRAKNARVAKKAPPERSPSPARPPPEPVRTASGRIRIRPKAFADDADESSIKQAMTMRLPARVGSRNRESRESTHRGPPKPPKPPKPATVAHATGDRVLVKWQGDGQHYPATLGQLSCKSTTHDTIALANHT